MRIINSRISLIAAGITLVAGAAFAQATGPAPKETTPGANSTGPTQSLSKLSQSNGVIHPKEVDPGIEKPTPSAHDPNVVPPPGTARVRAPAEVSARRVRQIMGNHFHLCVCIGIILLQNA